jgi:predicted nucleic acid-binding protein
MRTAVDTNVLSAILSSEAAAGRMAIALGNAKNEGGLVVSAPVFAELLAYPRATQSFVENFLESTGIAVEFELQRQTWLEAARRFARYATRRRRGAGEPKRLLVDFLIGAHALIQADRLMTLDPKAYKRDFPELRII